MKSGTADIYILKSLKEGHVSAFEFLFEKYTKVLYHFSFNILKSEIDAEEIVQNTFIKIWEKRERIDPSQPFNSYLFTIALNDIRKMFLKRAKENEFKLQLYDFLMERSNETAEGFDFNYYYNVLEEVIEKLPDKRKEIFLLQKKEGLSVNETANYLKISPKTVENQLTSALKTIKEGFIERNIKGLYLLFIGHLKPNHFRL